MKLSLITLVFAIGDFSIKRVLNKDKKIKSKYNTYKYKGLPPGPICIPSINSIDAVLNAANHNYIFYVCKEDFQDIIISLKHINNILKMRVNIKRH